MNYVNRTSVNTQCEQALVPEPCEQIQCKQTPNSSHVPVPRLRSSDGDFFMIAVYRHGVHRPWDVISDHRPWDVISVHRPLGMISVHRPLACDQCSQTLGCDQCSQTPSMSSVFTDPGM